MGNTRATEKGVKKCDPQKSIIKGRKTIDQVPAIIRDEVKQILKDLEVEV